MDDLISRREAEDMLTAFPIDDEPTLTKSCVRMTIQHMPTVDAVQVVHGRWIDETFAPWGLVHHPYKCDQCGDHSEAPSNYCPNCGAIMDGKGGEQE